MHHLTPKELGGTFLPTANVCIACHKQIHALYTNEELAIRLYTIASLQDDEKNFVVFFEMGSKAACYKASTHTEIK
ncbi:hypothetical protein GCM10020331_080230 [Ectobacillus funiculus]